MQYKLQNKNFYCLFHDITILEWMELDFGEDTDNERLAIAIEVSSAVDDWNGQGKIDPYALDLDLANHKFIYQIWQKLEKMRVNPVLKVQEINNKLVVTGKDFGCELKGLTILQFIEVVGKTKRDNPDESPAMFKCMAIAQNLIDWDYKGKLTASELYENREYHSYIAAIDVAITNFFRDDETDTICEPVSILDSSNDNGGDDSNQPVFLESRDDLIKRLSNDVERV